MKRFIDMHIPINSCNLKCHYCYVSHSNSSELKNTIKNIIKNIIRKNSNNFNYSAKAIGRALSQKRLGGVCHFNVCGTGETLIPKETIDIIYQLLLNGHYVIVVTNGLLSHRIEQLISLPDEMISRLGFKLSFHYLELLRTNQLELFTNNFNRIRSVNCSLSVELTPSDELEPYINDVIDYSVKNFGAKPHVTIPRNENSKNFSLLSKHTLEEFTAIWSVFDSELFKLKVSVWGQKRLEFCLAGERSALLNVGTGVMIPCYGCSQSQNILKDTSSPIIFKPIKEHCCIPHCFNSHSFLALGNIPKLRLYTYDQMRNRICTDGSEWLNSNMKFFLRNGYCELNSKRYVHFSIDDVFDVFFDLNTNKERYKTIFDNKLLFFLKELHDCYGAAFSLYVFYENNLKTLSQVGNLFKEDFLSNRHWLKFGFHARNNKVDYEKTEKLIAQADYNRVINELVRITGSFDCLDRLPRIHLYRGNRESVKGFMDAPYGIIGLLTADDERKSYFLEESLKEKYVDPDNFVKLIPTNIRLEHFKRSKSLDLELHKMEDRDRLVIFTHERYLSITKIKNMMRKCCDFAIRHDYRFSYPMLEE